MHTPRPGNYLSEHSEDRHHTGGTVLVLLMAAPKDASVMTVLSVQVDKLSEGTLPDFGLFLSADLQIRIASMP